MPRVSNRNRERRSEEWAAKLFKALGYSVTNHMLMAGFRIDLVVCKDNRSHPVEIKVPHSNTFGMNDIVREAARLRGVTLGGEHAAPILIVLAHVSEEARNWSQAEYGVLVWDLDFLREKTGPFPTLKQELGQLSEGQLALPKTSAAAADESARLIARLEAHLNQGGLTPRDYEELCQEVFVHLFDPDLYGFQRQSQTTDGANRYDFVCRIKPGNPFWDSLRQDFRTRAILFECKNYQDPIGADQIYSTERYLFSGGLRTVCFLLSRVPPSDGAIRAAQGAMRESGKLIILLSNEDLIAMIRLKGDREGPESFIDEKIWNFVVSLPR